MIRLVLLIALAPAMALASPAEDLHVVVEEYFDRSMEMNPVFATFNGDHRFNDRLENSIGPEHRAASEALGWTRDEALAYKIGELKIVELRDRAKERFGDQFDLRAFHDEILSDGALPLDVLEVKLDGWIEVQAGD